MEFPIFDPMRSSRTVFFIWTCLWLCLMPFIILSFLNVMASDDYILSGYYHDRGFWGMQKAFYLGWAGRYTTTFLTALFLKFHIVSNYYFLVALLFYFFTGVGIWWLLQSINKSWLLSPFGKGRMLLATFILLLLQIYTLSEISSAFYWLSSASVYQTAFILFLFFCGCLIRRPYITLRRQSRRMDLLIILLSVLLCGCNEITAVFLVALLSMLIGIFYYCRRPVPGILISCLVIVLIAGAFISFTSGVITVRHKVMTGNISYMATIPIIFFRWAAVFYYILKEPIFWVCAGILFITGARIKLKPSVFGSLEAIKGRNLFLRVLPAIFLIVFISLAIVLVVSKGSLPPRTLNNLISFTAFLMLIVIFLAGASYGEVVLTSIPATFITGALICALLANASYVEAWKSVLNGYFYHAIQKDRGQLLSAAKADDLRVVTLPSYEDALQKKINELFPHGVPRTMNDWLHEKPVTLYYWDDAEDPTVQFLHYYDLDSIKIVHTSASPVDAPEKSY